MLPFTYLSENIENHARPNNTCEIKDLESFEENMHPFLNKIPLTALTEEDITILGRYKELGYLKQTQDAFELNEGKDKGFPRLLIQIVDHELKDLAKNKHPEVYEFLKTDKIPKQLKKYLDTINDIEVKEITDKQPSKTAFEKILGNKNIFEKDVMMYGKNKQTLFAAAKRQLKTAPTPSKECAHDFINFAKNIIDKEIGYELKHFSYDVAQWYNHLSRNKQDKIEPVMQYYNDPQYVLNLTKKEIKDILSEEYEAICKAEIQTSDGKPRMVCAIPQNIKYTMGPVTWQLEEICQDHLQGYCGGKNLTEMAAQLNKYIDMGFTKIVEGDGSAFDNSQDISLKEIDRYIYSKIVDKIYHVPKEHFRHISQLHYKTMNVKYQKPNKKMTTYIRYKILGTVFSGDCDTTLANTVRMALYNRYVNERSGLKYGKDFIVMSKGDDFSVMYQEHIKDEEIRKIYNNYFLNKPTKEEEVLDKRQFGIGQICKFLEFGKPNSFKFCSLRSWYIDKYNHITLTRDPKKLYHQSLYAIKTKGYNPAQRYSYHIDMARSYLANYPGIRIFEIMAASHIKEATNIRETYNFKHPDRLKNVATHISEYLRTKKIMKTNPLGYTESMNKLLEQLMDIKGRKKFYNLYMSQYWEQVKKYEEIRTEINSKEELNYINSQIEEEFKSEELKSLLTQ